jgi:phosphoribosylformylglycinamidine synthase
MVMADTVRAPGLGAGLVRVHGTAKALAFTSDVTPRYVKANPVEGGKQAVAEAWRNLVAVGARPLAATDNLNFGNPEKPEIMGQLVGAIKGIGEACRALGFPIVSGNVSLYNETVRTGILPTPTIGGVGLAVVTVRAKWRRLPEGVSIINTVNGPVALDTRSWAVKALNGGDSAPSLTQAQAIALVRQRALPAAWQELPRRDQWRMVEGGELPALEVTP